MIIKYKNKEYESKYDSKTHTVGVLNPDSTILEVLYDDRIQRGLLLGELLCNPYYNLDEAVKNPLL